MNRRRFFACLLGLPIVLKAKLCPAGKPSTFGIAYQQIPINSGSWLGIDRTRVDFLDLSRWGIYHENVAIQEMLNSHYNSTGSREKAVENAARREVDNSMAQFRTFLASLRGAKPR